MVLSLKDLCLVRICNCMIDGILRTDLQIVSSYSRGLIFDTVVGRHKLSNANCLKYMKQLLADDSLRIIDAIPKQTRRLNLVERNSYNGFLKFLETHFNSFPAFADRITTLRLAAINGEFVKDEMAFLGRRADPETPTDLRAVLQIIRQCRNLRNLSLFIGDHLSFDSPHLLELLADALWSAGSAGLESLELAHYFGNQCNFAPDASQAIVFDQLKHLCLKSVSLTETSWINFLECCQDTLESLVLDNLNISWGDSIPFPLDRLTSMSISGADGDTLFLDKVAGRCPRLKVCHFELRQEDLDGYSVSDLKRLLPMFEDCSISLYLIHVVSPLLNETIDTAGDKITELTLDFLSHWTEDAARRVIVGCRNLRTLNLSDDRGGVSNGVLEKVLKDLFRNNDLASKLLVLYLHVALSEEMLDLLFANYVNLDVLQLPGRCARPTDKHLAVWTELGARPSRVLFGSTKATDQGLKTLIAACGSNLRELVVQYYYAENPDSVVEALMRCCPMLEYCQICRVSERIRAIHDRFSRNFLYGVSNLVFP